MTTTPRIVVPSLAGAPPPSEPSPSPEPSRGERAQSPADQALAELTTEGLIEPNDWQVALAVRGHRLVEDTRHRLARVPVPRSAGEVTKVNRGLVRDATVALAPLWSVLGHRAVEVDRKQWLGYPVFLSEKGLVALPGDAPFDMDVWRPLIRSELAKIDPKALMDALVETTSRATDAAEQGYKALCEATRPMGRRVLLIPGRNMMMGVSGTAGFGVGVYLSQVAHLGGLTGVVLVCLAGLGAMVTASFTTGRR